MKAQSLLLSAALALPLSTMAMDQAACTALAGEIDTHLKEAALAEMLAATASDPATSANNAQSAASTMKVVDGNLQMLEQSGCPAYPQPIDTSGYHNDALRCAYDLLKQRSGTPPCDQSTWTPKGRSETWHSFD